jgi:exosome complex RNA-binding protein Rrp4
MFCVAWWGALAGNKVVAIISHKMSMTNHISKGNFILIVVKNGNAMIKNTLRNDTRHLIDEDTFLNVFSFP